MSSLAVCLRLAPCSLLALAATVLGAVVHGQCAPQWIPGPPIAGTDGRVRCIVEWDPDGAGPQPRRVVVGGEFTAAGNAPASRIAAFDPATGQWSAFGTGMNGTVAALAVLPNGDLIAGGDFTTAGGAAIAFVARWDGVTWSPLGGGADNAVRALAVRPGGELIAAGWFNTIGGVAVNRVARWNGTAWASLGSGVVGSPLALAVLANGDVVAGGTLTSAGGVAVSNVARWNGTAWSPVGSGVNGQVNALVTRANGDLVAVGLIATLGNVARWNGTAWSSVGGGVPEAAHDVTELTNGHLVVAAGDVRRFDGAAWSVIGAADTAAEAVAALANGDLVAGGPLSTIDGAPFPNIARWNGVGWSALGAGAPTSLVATAVTTLPDGDSVVALSNPGWPFTTNIVRWDGTTLALLGVAAGNVRTLATAPNGDVIAGGFFGSVNGVPTTRIARWTGSGWMPLGSGMDWEVTAVDVLPNGDVVACGDFTTAGGVAANRVARWNGSQWSALGTGLVGSPLCLTIAANGDVVAGIGGGPVRVARWNGTAWSAVGSIGSVPTALGTLPNGDLVAAGYSQVARWNGAAWVPLATLTQALGSPYVQGLQVLPNGDVVIGGVFTTVGGVAANRLARWNGTAWSAMASVVGGIPNDLALTPGGTLVVAGVSRADGAASAGLVQLRPTCPATATASSTGCSGSGGLDVLAPVALPWVGSTYRALAGGLPANALALDVYGFATVAVPLAAIAPQGVAGCVLGVGLDFVGTLLPAGGVAATALAIPRTPALAGLVLHQQVVALELATGGALTGITASNRLTLTIGTL
jgi:hypothetical protein